MIIIIIIIKTKSVFKFTKIFLLYKARGIGETRSGTEKRCFHNLQSDHPAWW